MSRSGPKISSLFFTCDVMVFAEASVEQARLIENYMDQFCLASGQKVSYLKSNVYYSRNTDA